jgi:hypothetical protein
MRFTSSLSAVSALVMVLGLSHLSGCDGSDDASGQTAGLKGAGNDHGKGKKGHDDVCDLDDPTRGPDAEPHACAPDNDKKTTICHVPPGNPGNAHTLCIGNAAVEPHLQHHGDYLGPCKVETICPPPAGGGAGGSDGNTGGAGGQSGGAGGGEAGGAGGAATGGAGGAVDQGCGVGVNACAAGTQCASGTVCVSGCCVIP